MGIVLVMCGQLVVWNARGIGRSMGWCDKLVFALAIGSVAIYLGTFRLMLSGCVVICLEPVVRCGF